MIDINELRKVIADCYWPTSPVVINEILDRLEAAEKDITMKEEVIDSLATVIKRLDAQCDAVEKERDDFAQQLVQSEIGKREISEAHDALQVEVGKLKDLEVSRCVKINGYIVDNARLAEEVERLRAKIEQMEEQTPVGHVYRYGKDSHGRQWHGIYWYDHNLDVPTDTQLYALPGAQPAPSVPEGWKLVPIEPTLEMLRALIDGANQYDSWNEGYRDMIAAAPEAKS